VVLYEKLFEVLLQLWPDVMSVVISFYWAAQTWSWLYYLNHCVI